MMKKLNFDFSSEHRHEEDSVSADVNDDGPNEVIGAKVNGLDIPEEFLRNMKDIADCTPRALPQ